MSGSPVSNRTLPLDDIVPYWRNPRRINDEAVTAVAASIAEFGYQQPIVVDANNVIIIGHTRYSALRRLKWTEVPVLVAADLSPERARELRVVDNRTHEYSAWDFDELATELASLDAKLMRQFFTSDVTPDTDAGTDTTATEHWESVTDFVCPSCFHSWAMEVNLTDIESGTIRLEQ